VCWSTAPKSMVLTLKIEMSRITVIPPNLPTYSRKTHLKVIIFHRFLMKESQQLSFFVSKSNPIPTLLFISLFRMEFSLLDIRKSQLFQAKIFIENKNQDRPKLSRAKNLQLIDWCPLVYFFVNVPPYSFFIHFEVSRVSQSQSHCIIYLFLSLFFVVKTISLIILASYL